MRLFGGKIGFVGSGIHSLSSQILSKSFRNWFENRTLRGTKMERSFTSLLFSFIYLSIYTHLSLHIYPLTSYHIPPFHGNGEYWFPSEGALKADETTPCFRNIDIKNVTVNDKTYKKIDEKGITLDF